ncbi:MAG: HD domain-containing protein [Patescibacteria group bacterium]|nr:HD domain-containing protein [Patescibacteria group bacterium]
MNIYFELLKKYSNSVEDFEIIVNHGLDILGESLKIIQRKKLYKEVDFDLIVSGCILHDIGTFKYLKNFNKFQKNYIDHGIIGGKILREEGFKKEALVAERHIGSGLSMNYIIKNNIPLPKKDFLPISLEEKIICYADKFYSKSGKIDTLESIKKEMKGFGKEPFERFLELEKMFG